MQFCTGALLEAVGCNHRGQNRKTHKQPNHKRTSRSASGQTASSAGVDIRFCSNCEGLTERRIASTSSSLIAMREHK